MTRSGTLPRRPVGDLDSSLANPPFIYSLDKASDIGREAERMSGKRWSRLMVVLSTLVLGSACGGGGGEGSGAGGSTPTGLIPTAPSIGAVLRSDATVLRPLLPGAVWNYWGLEGSYGINVTHRAAPGGGVVEASDSYGEQTVTLRGGEVHVAGSVPLPDGRVVRIDQLELRSPVRLDDQFVIFDQTISNSGVDVDGDRVNDAVDIAIYSRVIGEEVLDLQNRPQTPSIRVRTVLQSRFKQSRTGTYSEASTSTIDTWYSDDLGIVMQRTDVPDGLGTRSIRTEQLFNWDAVDRGIGFLPTQWARNPVTDAPLAFALNVASFDTHALLLTYASGQPYVAPDPAAGIALSKVDARGNVVATSVVAGINASRSQVFRVGDAARVVEATSTGIVMHSFDASGNRTAATPVDLKGGPIEPFFGPAGNPFAGVSTGNVLWLAWCEPASSVAAYDATLRIQPFDASGNALAAATVLSQAMCTTTRAPQLAGGRDRVIVLLDGRRYAIARSDLLTVTAPADLPIGALTSEPQAGISDASPALLWLTYGLPDPRLGGVSIDDAGAVLLSSSTTAPGFETLPISWLSLLQYLRVSSGSHLDVYAEGSGKLWPADTSASTVSTVTEIVPGPGPLATVGRAKLLARGSLPQTTHLASLTNHVLLFASTDGGINVTSVWRR